MENITFSDSQTTSKEVITSETEATSFLLEEYCKRYPESIECLEYDV